MLIRLQLTLLPTEMGAIGLNRQFSVRTSSMLLTVSFSRSILENKYELYTPFLKVMSSVVISDIMEAVEHYLKLQI